MSREDFENAREDRLRDRSSEFADSFKGHKYVMIHRGTPEQKIVELFNIRLITAAVISGATCWEVKHKELSKLTDDERDNFLRSNPTAAINNSSDAGDTLFFAKRE